MAQYDDIYQAVIMASAPWMWWRLGDDVGQNYAIDSSGNGRDSNVSGSSPLTFGSTSYQVVGTSATAHGSTDQFNYSDSTPMSSNTWTVEVWCRPTASTYNHGEGTGGTTFATNTPNEMVLYADQGPNAGLAVGTDGIHSWEHDTGYAPCLAKYRTSISSTAMHHVVLVMSSKQHILYLDGVDVRYGNTSGRTNVWAPATVGAKAYSNGFSGEIAEVAWYDRALGLAEVRNHYLAGTAAINGEVLSAYDNVVLGDDPTEYYPLDDQSGSYAINFGTSTSRKTGTYSGSPTLDQTGPGDPRPAKAVSFDGTDDYTQGLSLGIDPSTDSFTVEAWIKPDLSGVPSDLDTMIAIQQDDGTGTGRTWMGVENDAGSYLAYSYIGGSFTSSSTEVTDDSWVHCVVTYDQTNVVIYLDGEQDVTSARTGEAATGDLIIGSGKTPPSNPFKGDVAGVAIYDRVLTPAEITQHYEAAEFITGPEQGLDELGAILHLPLDETHGTVAYATVGDDGTYSGGPTLNVTGPSDVLPFGISTDGTDDYVDASFDGTILGNRVTLEVWLKSTDTAADARILGSFNSGSTTGIQWRVNADSNANRSQMYLRDQDGNRHDAYFTNASMTDGAWHHYAWVVGGSANPVAYVDGVSQTVTTVVNENPDNTVDLTHGLEIGVLNSNGSRSAWWEGSVCAFTVYDSELTAAQVLARYRAGLTRYDRIVRDDDPVLYLPLRDDTGTTATSSIGPDGTYENSPTLRQTGPVTNEAPTKAVSFDGSNDRVYVAAADMPTITSGGITCECWYKGTDGNGFLMGKPTEPLGTAGQKSYEIETYSGSLYWSIGNGSTTSTGSVSSSVITDDEWHHIVGTWDGTNGTDNVILYVDGEVAFSGDYASTTIRNDASANFSVGRSYGSTESLVRLSGLVTGVAVYDYGLTEFQVREHYWVGKSLWIGGGSNAAMVMG